MKVALFAPLLPLASAAVAAQGSPSLTRALIGIWRLDRAASSLHGPRLDIGAAPGGYAFRFGAARFVLPEDGCLHPTVPGREMSLRRIDARHWERVHRAGGRDVDRSLIALSPDGRTLTIRTSAAGRPPEEETLTRIGAGRGMAGSWRSGKADVDVAEREEFADAGAGRVRWSVPSEGNWYVVAPNGPAAVDQGPTATSAATLRMTTSGPGRFDWVERVGGAPFRAGRLAVSADGGTLVDLSWPAATPGERQRAVYRRIGG